MMDDTLFNEKLQSILRGIDEMIDVYTLAKKMDMHVDSMLEKILLIQQQYQKIYKDNVRNMLKADKVFMEKFFKDQVIDLGMLLQHKVKDINEPLKEKLNSMGHQLFYNGWLLNRGY